MPIANCFIDNEYAESVDFQKFVNEWAELLAVDEKEITLNILTDFKQYGQNFKVMANLLLPTIWSPSDIVKIQKTFSNLLKNYLKIEPNEIFIVTSLIESGHVYFNGNIETW